MPFCVPGHDRSAEPREGERCLPVVAPPLRSSSRSPSRSRLLTWAVVAAVLALATTGCPAPEEPAASDGSARATEVAARGVDTSPSSEDPGWEPVEPGPLGSIKGGTWVWTGREVLVVGIRTPGRYPAPEATGGAAYDPAAGTWREIAPGAPRGIGEVAWTGAVVLAHVPDPDPTLPGRAFVYDPDGDRWWRTGDPPAPAASGFRGLIWTGTEVVAPGLLAAWNPASGHWRPLAPLPPEAFGRSFSAVRWGQSVRFVARDQDLAYDPVTDAWEVLAGAGVLPAPKLATVGDRIVGVSTSLAGTTFTLQAFADEGGDGDGWVRLPDPPLAGERCGVAATDWGDAAVFDVCSGFAVLDRDGRWTAIARPPGNRAHRSTLIAGGGWLYAVDPGDGDDTTSGPVTLHRRPPPDVVGPAEDPPPPSSARPPEDATTRPTVALGSVQLDVPPGYAVVDEPSASTPAGGTVVSLALPVVPPWPPAPPCTLEVTADPGGDAFAELAAQSVATQEGFPNRAVLDNGAIDDRYHVIVRLRPDEVLDIACAQRFNPEALFGALR